MSHKKKQKAEITIRNVTKVKGGICFDAVFIATKDAAQRKQATTKDTLEEKGIFFC
jgi:hypothetical protein